MTTAKQYAARIVPTATYPEKIQAIRQMGQDFLEELRTLAQEPSASIFVALNTQDEKWQEMSRLVRGVGIQPIGFRALVAREMPEIYKTWLTWKPI